VSVAVRLELAKNQYRSALGEGCAYYDAVDGVVPFHLDPVATAWPVAAIVTLGDDALETAVADEPCTGDLGIVSLKTELEVGELSSEQSLELRSTETKRPGTQVLAGQFEQVEGDKGCAMLSRGLECPAWTESEPCLKQGEVGQAVSAANDDFAVQRGVEREGPAGLGKLGEGTRQIVAVSAEEPNTSGVCRSNPRKPSSLGS
jgi:hypothetical protein